MQQPFIKLITIHSNMNALGLVPIYVRITIDGRRTYRSTGHYVHPNIWDKGAERVRDAHPLAAEINADIADKKRRFLASVVQAGGKDKRVTVHHDSDYFAFAEAHIEELRSSDKRQYDTLERYEKHLGKLREYHGERPLPLGALSPAYLDAFEAWLRTPGEDHQLRKGRGVSKRIAATLKTVRWLLNEALASLGSFPK